MQSYGNLLSYYHTGLLMLLLLFKVNLIIVQLWLMTLSEYAGNIGDERDKIARDAEQQKILQLMDKFWVCVPIT